MSIDLEPIGEVVLECWSIRQASDGTRYFVGWNVYSRNGRVSTPIVSFDPQRRTGLTRSGSAYRLVGRAGHDSDAEYVWNHALRVWGISTWRDVTAELIPDWRNPDPLIETENGRAPEDGNSESLPVRRTLEISNVVHTRRTPTSADQKGVDQPEMGPAV